MICIYLSSPVGSKISKMAILWYTGSYDDANLISPKLVREVLCTEVQKPKEEGRDTRVQFNGRMIEAQGFVDLEWGFERSKATRETRFIVVSLYDPPFDVLLGRKTAVECGLASPTLDSARTRTPERENR